MQTNLRDNAEQRIKAGTAPTSQGWRTGAQALTLLHGLASAPESAGDALKLLHELQVHQVELDLQQEQVENDRRQLAEDLVSATALFDLAPFAYVTLEPDGQLVSVNRAAAQWLNLHAGDRQAWAGRRIGDLVTLDSRAGLQGLLAALQAGEARRTCAVQCAAGGASAQAVATAMPGSTQVLMAFIPTA